VSVGFDYICGNERNTTTLYSFLLLKPLLVTKQEVDPPPCPPSLHHCIKGQHPTEILRNKTDVISNI